MGNRAVKRIGDERLRLGEGPVWDNEKNVLYYVDIEGKKIGCFCPGTGEHTFWETEKMPGCLVLDDKGNLIVAEENTLVRIKPSSGEREKIAVLDIPEGLRFNDGKCDYRGRFWVGGMAIHLYCLKHINETGFTLHLKAESNFLEKLAYSVLKRIVGCFYGLYSLS